MTPTRNPGWTRDETILALDTYFKARDSQFTKNNPLILELSQLLIALPLHPIESRTASFRNPPGVYMKLCNFLRCDPSYLIEDHSGLTNGSRLDIEVWNQFTNDREYLSSTANAIKAHYMSDSVQQESLVLDDDEEALEGKLLLRLHRRRERNRSLVNKKKRMALAKFGILSCEVCEFEFEEKYGEIGNGFIETHHKIALADLPAGEVKTKLSDLVLVCSNCHRMLHRQGGRIGIEEMKLRVTET